jgi:hypothetical protein
VTTPNRWTKGTVYADMWVDPAVVAEAWEAWLAEVAFASTWTQGATDLGGYYAGNGPLRDILVHMTEEYARHCGHADLLREAVDGRTGQ